MVGGLTGESRYPVGDMSCACICGGLTGVIGGPLDRCPKGGISGRDASSFAGSSATNSVAAAIEGKASTCGEIASSSKAKLVEMV